MGDASALTLYSKYVDTTQRFIDIDSSAKQSSGAITLGAIAAC